MQRFNGGEYYSHRAVAAPTIVVYQLWALTTWATCHPGSKAISWIYLLDKSRVTQGIYDLPLGQALKDFSCPQKEFGCS